MIRPPPTSTLFPSTTLSRSRESGSVFMLPTYLFLGCMVLLLSWGLVVYGFGPPGPTKTFEPPIEPLTLALLLRAFASGGAALTDRKSTRLNSSHSQISYAVF